MDRLEDVPEEAQAIDDAVGEVGTGSGIDVGGTGSGEVVHTVVSQPDDTPADPPSA